MALFRSIAPSLRLAGTASPHLCLRACAVASPPNVARTFLSARVFEGRQECLPHPTALHRCDKRDACPTFQRLYRELVPGRWAGWFGTGGEQETGDRGRETCAQRKRRVYYTNACDAGGCRYRRGLGERKSRNAGARRPRRYRSPIMRRINTPRRPRAP